MPHEPLASGDARDCLSGGGAMGAEMRDKDWSKTLLGPVESWPLALRTIVSVCLGSRFPILVWWGPELVKLYNDAYRVMLGNKHPAALGARGREIWPEIWPTIGPMLDGVMARGEATWSENILLPLARNGFLEECYFTFSYSPIRDESGAIAGVFSAITETTGQVLGERRLRTLRDLGERTMSADTEEGVCRAVEAVLQQNEADVPLTALFVQGPARDALLRVGATGDVRWEASAPRRLVELSGPMSVAELERHLEAPLLGIQAFAASRVCLLPLPGTSASAPAGVLVAGLSARLVHDEPYLDFLGLIAKQISAALERARALSEAERRAEALAELDRAKTAFFSNVSHEFRTPLTLMLGPVEDALADTEHELPLRQRERIELVGRNAQRLSKLVNTLLDFARLEAGRLETNARPTDLAAATRELTSQFRSAIERVGLVLDTSGIEDLGEPVLLDREMWEKIVLNLLSNALKFTFEGTISVALRAVDGFAELSVRDTGIGIAPEHLPRLFERFYRVRGARARTHEGTGIGLALVQELARLHGGSVRAESEPGRGATFVVRVRTCGDHASERVPRTERPESTAVSAAVFVAEALRWDRAEPARPLPSAPERSSSKPATATTGAKAKVLIADDNADVREYLKRLFSSLHDVRTARDGSAALESAVVDPPDLVLTDVMMPVMDGFELIRALRADPRTQHVPVMLLSARAGEEATAEGLAAGADDYVVKPFSARELLARVDALLARGAEAARRRQELEELARARQEAESANRSKDEFLAIIGHELRNPLAPIVSALEVMESKGLAPRERPILDRQVRHLKRLVDDLLDVSRLTRGRLALTREVVDMADVIEDAIEMSGTVAPTHGQTLTASVPRGELYVDGDRGRLAQVVSNLLTNASKFTGRDGHIGVTAALEQDTVVVRVRDDGTGISREFLPRIFELFEQDQKSFARSEGGLGLGLAIVKHIVTLHAGSVAAFSEGIGHGAELVVRLPSAGARRPAALPAARPESPVRAPAPLRVLVVDDNIDGAEMLQELLRAMGHVTSVAFDGPDALAVADEFRPDVALVDLGLPTMSGFEVASRLRQRLPQHVRLIAVTGYGQASDRSRSREAGFDQHLVKPVDAELLAVAMRPASA